MEMADAFRRTIGKDGIGDFDAFTAKRFDIKAWGRVAYPRGAEPDAHQPRRG